MNYGYLFWLVVAALCTIGVFMATGACFVISFADDSGVGCLAGVVGIFAVAALVCLDVWLGAHV